MRHVLPLTIAEKRVVMSSLSQENLLLQVLPLRATSVAKRYVVTATIVGIFVLLQMGLSDTLVGRPYLLLILPVFLSALIFNRGSGYFATVLAAVAANWFFLEPTHSLLPAAMEDRVATVLFLVIGACIATLTEALRIALEETARKEHERWLLLQELNHRIRNDFQMVASLIRLSTKTGTDPKQALEDAADRVSVMSAVYERLTSSDGSVQLNAKDFLEGLAADHQARIVGVRGVTIVADAEPISIGTRCATAVGLITSELVTNALKHAFPGDRMGSVRINLRRESDGLRLSVCDDGVGFVDEETRRVGFGTKLVRQMATQHGGTVDFESRAGLRVVVKLPAACLA